MCRNIRTLHNFEPPASAEEIRSAALQYVRKVSGMQKPSRANEDAIDRAVDEVEAATSRLLASLVTSAPPRDREVEAERRRARADRFWPGCLGMARARQICGLIPAGRWVEANDTSGDRSHRMGY
jgi:hypothetical protein